MVFPPGRPVPRVVFSGGTGDLRDGGTCRPRRGAARAGVRTADAEEPRGAELREQRGRKKTHEDEGGPLAVKTICPANFGNSHIYGGSYPTRRNSRNRTTRHREGAAVAAPSRVLVV